MSTVEVLESYVQLRRSIALARASENKALEFGHNQISFLYRLALSSATMTELSEYTASDKSSTTRTVKLLEKKGYVKRSPHPEDGRVTVIELTAKGRVQAKKAEDIRHAIGEKLNSCLSQAERKQFTQLINKLVDGLTTLKSK